MTDEGFLVILSGAVGDGESEAARVGFIIAPHVRRSVYSFRQHSSRIVSLRLRVLGGKALVVSAYTPHSGYSYDIRQNFFHELQEYVQGQSCHGPKLVYGDFNSRLYRHFDGEGDEDAVIGPYIFGNPASNVPADANRHLLVEMCIGTDMVVANTFCFKGVDQTVTSYNVGSQNAPEASWATHSEIDFVLCQRQWRHVVSSVASDRYEALASHHFLVRSVLDIVIEKVAPDRRAGCLDARLLFNSMTANRFAQIFDSHMAECDNEADRDDLDLQYAKISDAFNSAAGETLGRRTVKRRRPWITERTLRIIEDRGSARQWGDNAEERRLNVAIRQSVKRDRGIWLNDLVASGDWASIRKLKKGFIPAQGRLKNENGFLVDSDLRAETLADHLQNVQWRVRPEIVSDDRPPLGDQLGIQMGDITRKELTKAARRMRCNKACGLDGVPAEFWKAICMHDGPAVNWILDFATNVYITSACPKLGIDLA